MIPPGIDVQAIEPAPPSDRARPVILHAPVVAPPQGNRARDRGLRGPRRRPRPRRGAPPRRGVRALPRGRHRRRPAERGLVRAVRDRVHGAREAGRHVPPRRGGRADRARSSARAFRSCSATKETCARGSSRSSPRPPSGDESAPSRARTSSRSTTSSASPTACSLSTLGSDVVARRHSSSGSASTRRSTGSAGSSRGSSPSSSSRSTRATSRRPTTGRSRRSSRSRR